MSSIGDVKSIANIASLERECDRQLDDTSVRSRAQILHFNNIVTF